MPELVFQNVSKSYGRLAPVVSDFNLVVGDGELLVLVGPSGCGKSTTLRMLAGLETITKGEIFIDSRRMNDVHPRDRDIAMVFQNYALYPHMNVYQNLALNLRVRRLPRDEVDRRVKKAAALLGIEEYLHRKPAALSGGQKQRVAVGRAIVREPKVFLFDEPLSNLDAKLRVQMRTEIAALHQRLRATMVYVTHDQVEAMTLGTRIAVMRDGVIQQVATPLELFHVPSNIFVAGFIGSPPMNFVTGTLIRNSVPRFVNQSHTVNFSIPDVEPAVLTKFEGKEILLGIRPEYLAPGSAGNSAFAATPRLVETLGSEVILYFDLGQEEVICRMGADLFAGEEVMHFRFPHDKVHFFDPKSGDRVKWLMKSPKVVDVSFAAEET